MPTDREMPKDTSSRKFETVADFLKMISTARFTERIGVDWVCDWFNGCAERALAAYEQQQKINLLTGAPGCTYPNCDCEIHLCKATLAREEKENQDMNKDVYEITEWQIGRRFSVKGFDFELDLKSHLHSIGITATWGTKHKMKGFWSLRSGVVLTPAGSPPSDFNLTEREEQAIGEVCARLWVEEHPTDILKK